MTSRPQRSSSEVTLAKFQRYKRNLVSLQLCFNQAKVSFKALVEFKKYTTFLPLLVTLLRVKTTEVWSSCFPRPGRRPGTAPCFHTGGDNEVYTPAKTNHQHVLALRQDYAQSQTVRPRTRLSLFFFFLRKNEKTWQCQMNHLKQRR